MTSGLDKLYNLLDQKKERMIQIRRQLHENPELSFQETRTAKFIADFYKNKDCIVSSNIGGNGVVVVIDSGKPGKNIAIRADFDALPIQEETGLPFASKNPGVMHACGHDGHTAYMLILAESLIELKEEFTGKITILHQPAEETPPGGAIHMIKDGCLDGVDAVLGIHVMSGLPVGTVHYHAGPTQSGRATFKVKIQGKGSHGSMPNAGIDSILVASQFVVNIQSIVSRKTDPFDMATVTIGSFDGKGSANVLKDSVILEGDVRVMNEAARDIIETEFKRILAGICSAYGATYELNYENDYPVLVNDEKMTDLVSTTLKSADFPELTAVEECKAQAPSEDFAYYCLERPSCFFYVGATGSGQVAYPHHHPKFDIDEECLMVAAKSMASCVWNYSKDI
ncbi:M20 family metallopeptidase [Enterococcus sp. LJL99]